MVSRQNISPRTAVIPGAQDDGFHVSDVFHCPPQPINHVFSMSRADIQGLRASQITVLPALPNGKRIAVLGVYSEKAAGAYAGGANVLIRYDSTGTPHVASIPLAQFRLAAANSRWGSIEDFTGDPDALVVPAGGLLASVATAFTGNGGTVTLTIRYVEVG